MNCVPMGFEKSRWYQTVSRLCSSSTHVLLTLARRFCEVGLYRIECILQMADSTNGNFCTGRKILHSIPETRSLLHWKLRMKYSTSAKIPHEKQIAKLKQTLAHSASKTIYMVVQKREYSSYASRYILFEGYRFNSKFIWWWWLLSTVTQS